MSVTLAQPRVLHWLWWSRAPAARAVRALLLPAGGIYRGVMLARAAAYAGGWRRPAALPLPAVAVGSLSVGGAGKTPIAAWIAAFYQRRGLVPGVLLRGYGGDEALVHQRLVPGAVVIANPDRIAGAAAALAGGARVLVLDDAYQRLDLARDLNIAVVNAENARAVRWPLPAGPWREGWGALRRADLLVITRRRVGLEDAVRLGAHLSRYCPRAPRAVAQLVPDGFRGMLSERRVAAEALAGRR
ncbi:MAG TPA: tetraacyldisaccharide 4'-kinase, partial [Gemmatimonadales bacterium]|nr:tetraacyldisaccharide 4'-kinase [Gemmatimonadales bacterium]